MTGISDRILDPDYILAEVVSRSKNFSLAPRIVETFREFLGYNFREHTHTHSLTLFLSPRGDFNLENTRKLSKRDVRWPSEARRESSDG